MRPLSTAELQQPCDVTLMLRERPGAPTLLQSLEWTRAAAAHLTDAQLRARHAPAHSDRESVMAWARHNGLRVLHEDPATRRISLRGTTARLGELFGVRLERFRADASSVEYRGHAGPVRVPALLQDVVRGVYGLDDRPIARTHLREPDASRAALVSYDPPDIAAAYAYPPLPRFGEGLHLVAGMIELGGVTHSADLAASFTRLGLLPPAILNVSVDGTVPQPDPSGADLEVALDYQVLGAMVMAMAPRARLTIVTYNAANTERGFIDAVATAASDEVNRPLAVSISWGAPEDGWSEQGMRGMDSAFAAGALRGVTYSAAAGDAGSTDASDDGRQHPEFPASSPHVWACGGTTLLAVGGHVISETVWNELALGAGAAGSGVSRVFAPPAYQTGAGLHPRSADGGLPGRGLPDGAGVADPVTGWNVVALGRLRVTGGTSAVAPMYTALWTLVAGLRDRRIGMPHPALYAARGRGFRDIVQGDTGGPYAARRGWDTASGWGSPDGRAIARELALAERRARGPGARAHAERLGVELA
ncbi:MAG: S8/S53 family peptidase [Candidatus Dormibacteraeota bacterium]|nr:S8/S53 family peptidase [Candidatus Dormibacteraeota bacterium]MBV9526661.1 S8/S53 family peptidase [Candidatus Dormibacteraeota bacterium]